MPWSSRLEQVCACARPRNAHRALRIVPLVSTLALLSSCCCAELKDAVFLPNAAAMLLLNTISDVRGGRPKSQAQYVFCLCSTAHTAVPRV